MYQFIGEGFSICGDKQNRVLESDTQYTSVKIYNH